jgi:hypothetical protein
MQKKLILIFSLIFGATVSLAASIDKLNVDNANDFVLGPSKIEIFADPGETVVRTITVTNRTAKTVSYKVQMEDFVGSTDPSNPLVLLGKQRSKYTFVDHIVPDVTEFKLDFGERITIPVKIQVPSDASPGGYYTSVIVSNEPDKTSNATNGGAVSVSRVGALLFIRVNGEVREEGKLEDFRVSGPSSKFVYGSMPTDFEVLFSNKGSVHLAPYGKAEIRNIFGKVINATPIDAFFALPDSLRQRSVIFEKGGFMFGRYTATVELFRGYDDLKDSKTISFWVIPWIVIVIFVIVILILYSIYRFLGSKFEIKRK